MPISPICLVQDGASPFVPTTNGVNVTTGNTISVKLADPTGVVDWYLEVTGFDELSSAPSLMFVNPITHKVVSPVATPSFPMPSAKGRAFLLTSTVTDISGSVTSSFAVYTLTDLGTRVAAAGETIEGNSLFGWASVVNPLIRSGAPVLLYDDTLTAPALGANSVQDALDVLKTTGGPPGPPGPPGPGTGTRWDLALASNVETTNTPVARRIGSRTIDLTDYPASAGALTRQVRLYAILDALAGTTTIKLTDVTLGPPVIITNSTLSTGSLSPVEVSALIPVGDSPGRLWESVSHNYELTVESSGVGTCAGVWLSIRYA